MDFRHDYSGLLNDRTVLPAGDLRRFQCPFHADGDDPKRWSAVGYPDGSCWCYGCKRAFGVVDLEVRRRIGRCVTVGQSIGDDTVMRETYHAVLSDDARFAEFSDSSKASSSGHSYNEKRAYTQLERTFLWEVYDLMRKALLGRQITGRRTAIADYEALYYLEQRGCGPLECIGVARWWQMPLIHDIAKRLGDPSLPYTTGIESRNERYKGKMHYLLRDSVVTFRFGKVDGEVLYYQARAIDPERSVRYYCPPGIVKMPLMFGSGPTLCAEGWYTVAGYVNHGFTVMALLGSPARDFPAPMFKPLHNGIYIADRNRVGEDGKKAGTVNAQTVYEKVVYSGWKCQVVYPGGRHAQADEWAKDIGWERAAKYLHSMLVPRNADLYGLRPALSASGQKELAHG